jgi:hypothetical protein
MQASFYEGASMKTLTIKCLFLIVIFAMLTLAAYGQESKVGTVGIIEDTGFDYEVGGLESHIDKENIGFDLWNISDCNAVPYEESLSVSGQNLYSHATHVMNVLTKDSTLMVKLIRLPPVRWVMDENYFSKEQWAEKAIDAVQKLHKSGVRIFNISQGDGNTEVLKFLCPLMNSMNDSVFVIAAGNDGRNLDDKSDNYISYPQDCNKTSNMIIVGSGSRISKHTFSNYGQQTVDIMANGYRVKSFDEKISGTSFAAPFVAKAIAEIQMASSNFSALEAKDYLLNHCRKKPRLQKYIKTSCFLGKSGLKRLIKKL